MQALLTRRNNNRIIMIGKLLLNWIINLQMVLNWLTWFILLRTKAVLFVMIVYYWDHASDSVKCVSHTCITSDMRKRNEQVTKFIETVLAQYYVMQQNFGFGSPMIISFWSDNCGDQFKNKYHFGWWSRYLESKELLALFVNYFAPGHGKGICDSEGGIAKHAVANAALHGEKFRSAIDLYRWLVANGGEVQSKTPLATHSPDRRQYHYFVEGAFLDYHPIDLKIDRLNCYYSFNFNRANPSTLRSRKTSCFCISCKDGNFDDCVDTSFHGRHHINQLNISDVERIPEHISIWGWSWKIECRNWELSMNGRTW